MVFPWLLACVVGTAVGGVSYAFGSTNLLLTGTVALTYAAGTRLSVAHPDVVYEEQTPVWTVGRWSAGMIALVCIGAFFGVNPFLAVDGGLRFSLQMLVVGSGYTAWVFGVAYARAKA